jgi:superfamily II DNA or RNA helicase
MKKLEAHDLDVIVQVRKLGEGFDHPFLSVAAVFSIFASLSPFVQFVGRVMRVIKQNSPNDPINQGTVVFHSGANIASRWEDFQEYSEADQQFFDQILPVEGLDFANADEIIVAPVPREPNTLEVRGQTEVIVEEIPLLDDDEAMEAIATLRARGYSPEQVWRAMEHQPVPTTRVYERQAARAALDMRIKTETGSILKQKQMRNEGKELDKNHLNKSNFVILKSAIDKHVNQSVGKSQGKRHEFVKSELDKINESFPDLVAAAVKEVFGG